MARGNVALIDGVSALSVVLILVLSVAYFGNGSAGQAFQGGIEKEQLRLQLYALIFDGGLQVLALSPNTTHFEANGLVLDTVQPANTTFVKFFISDASGGVREFFVYEKG
jgi:hypothetical protein